jgi:hypothetical protein
LFFQEPMKITQVVHFLVEEVKACKCSSADEKDA